MSEHLTSCACSPGSLPSSMQEPNPQGPLRGERESLGKCPCPLPHSSHPSSQFGRVSPPLLSQSPPGWGPRCPQDHVLFRSLSTGFSFFPFLYFQMCASHDHLPPTPKLPKPKSLSVSLFLALWGLGGWGRGSSGEPGRWGNRSFRKAHYKRKG